MQCIRHILKDKDHLRWLKFFDTITMKNIHPGASLSRFFFARNRKLNWFCSKHHIFKVFMKTTHSPHVASGERVGQRWSRFTFLTKENLFVYQRTCLKTRRSSPDSNNLLQSVLPWVKLYVMLTDWEVPLFRSCSWFDCSNSLTFPLQGSNVKKIKLDKRQKKLG